MSATVATTRGYVAAKDRERRRTMRRIREAPIYAFLFGCAALSVFTTGAIVVVLVEEALLFFEHVNPIDFITGTTWTPTFADAHFGVLPLFSATLLMAAGAMVVAIPLGVLAAIYLSEYADARVRRVIKPVLEVLAGIPTVVYGYFALQFITPELLRGAFGNDVSIFNAAAASIAMGIMILP